MSSTRTQFFPLTFLMPNVEASIEEILFATEKLGALGEYKNFRKQIELLIKTEKTIDYQPTKIILSEKF
ncbi:MAG: hypothetical protein IKG61_10455 [Selenomonadaceae bacterium]|nr:hypothetical protein [Selenomonadaceae bacterium]